MSEKTKIQKTTEVFNQAAMQGGVVLMAAAATLGLVEVPQDPDKRTLLPNKPAYAVAHEGGSAAAGNEEMRREKEEVHPHSRGYSLNQRTPSRSGRV